jgi:hypothetical protein
LAPPKLRISLRSTGSEEIDTGVQNPNEPATPILTKSRWFHIRVTNARKWADAADVQVFLTRIEKPNAADLFTAIWIGEVPLKWRFMTAANPAPTRAIGHDAEADLVALLKRGATTLQPFLQLQPLYISSSLPVHHVGQSKLRLILLARGSRRAVSNPLVIEIAWDGQWPEKGEDPTQHIVVREVPLDKA